MNKTEFIKEYCSYFDETINKMVTAVNPEFEKDLDQLIKQVKEDCAKIVDGFTKYEVNAWTRIKDIKQIAKAIRDNK